jgi:hypothetical protein
MIESPRAATSPTASASRRIGASAHRRQLIVLRAAVERASI